MGELHASLDLAGWEQHHVRLKVKRRGEEPHGQVYAEEQMEEVGALTLSGQALQKEGEFKEGWGKKKFSFQCVRSNIIEQG